MSNQRKDTVFQIRISSELLNDFKLKCNNSTPKIVPTEWLRENIVKFVKGDGNNGKETIT